MQKVSKSVFTFYVNFINIYLHQEGCVFIRILFGNRIKQKLF